MKQNKPLILAHRGLVTEFQENTLAAVKGSMDSSVCDGCEFDVFLTKDNRVVLFHDENMKRLTGEDKIIYDMTWADLKGIKVLKEIEVDGGMRVYEKEREIPLLEDVLEEIKGKDCFVDIELKAYAPKWSKRRIGREVARIIRQMEMEKQVVCTSFNFFMLYDLEKAHRGVLSGFAYDDNMPVSGNRLNRMMESNLIGRFVHSNVVCTEYTLIDEDTIKKYHSRGMKVGTFTLFPLTPIGQEHQQKAHYAKEVKRLTQLGVDWIETDHPAMAHEIVYSS